MKDLKIDWDVYFISLTFLISQKSIDPNTKHAAILVSKNNKILATGYNGPLQNVDDSRIPLTRPEKYYHLLHSEENCLLSYDGTNINMRDSRIYNTGRPCHKCLRMMIQKGVKKIICGPVNSKCLDDDDLKAQKLMLDLKPFVKIIDFKNIQKVIDLLNNTISYIKNKTE